MGQTVQESSVVFPAMHLCHANQRTTAIVVPIATYVMIAVLTSLSALLVAFSTDCCSDLYKECCSSGCKNCCSGDCCSHNCCTGNCNCSGNCTCDFCCSDSCIEAVLCAIFCLPCLLLDIKL